MTEPPTIAKGYKVQKYKVRLVKDGAVRVLPAPRVSGSAFAYSVFRSIMKGLPHEEVWACFANARNDITGLVRIAQGGMHGAAMTPADVLRPALLAGASGFVLAHNHPSGDPTPSSADVEMTKRLLAACSVVGVSMLDHLILTEAGEWVSMVDTCSGLDW